MEKEVNECFEPFVDNESKILILGSFPSVKSREINFYYGNKQNRIWKIFEEFFGVTIGDCVEEKKKFLKEHHIALWDIVKSANIKGSSDFQLLKSDFQINDIESLTKKFSNIQKIFCNGKLSFNLTQTYFPFLEISYLPSTSPANVSFKKEIWFDALKCLK